MQFNFAWFAVTCWPGDHCDCPVPDQRPWDRSGL